MLMRLFSNRSKVGTNQNARIILRCQMHFRVCVLLQPSVCVCILHWPLPNGAFQDQYKQTMINKYSNQHNYVKNPNWQEADQLAIYKRSREVELGATENNIS